MPLLSNQTPTPGNGVRFRDVVLRRGAATVFDGLTLNLAERRIGLIGDNGSGKSSLLRLGNGLLLPDSGSVTLYGLETRPERARLPAVAGFLFQIAEHQILFPTVGEEIAFGMREAGIQPDTAMQRVRTILCEYGWTGWEDRPVQQLSDGQKQRLCILAVLAMQPKILLLDEPFASLDWPTRQRLGAELMELPQQIVMASHDFELFEHFDRIVWLENGRIAGDGRPHDVIARYKEASAPVTIREAAQ